jgi:hypothetical protein
MRRGAKTGSCPLCKEQNKIHILLKKKQTQWWWEKFLNTEWVTQTMEI